MQHAVRGPWPARALTRAVLVAVLATVAFAGCGTEDQGDNLDPDQVDAVDAPELGACRVLTPEDVAEPDNATKAVDCAEEHTAETFAVGDLPERVRRRGLRRRGARRLGLPDLLEAVQGLPRRRREPGDAHRRQLGVVPAVRGGLGRRRPLVPLRRGRRRRAEQGVRRPPDERQGPAPRPPEGRPGWSAPTARPSPARSRCPCTEPHNWRAVTTISLGEPEDDYPGDRLAEVDHPRLLLRSRSAPGSTTPSTTTSATRGSTRPSGTPATDARSAGRRPTE